MGIGFSIFLIALGAIIAFGIDVQLSWLNLAVVGWVLMLAGITGIFLTLYFWNRRRRATGVVEERRYYDGRTPTNPSYNSHTATTTYDEVQYDESQQDGTGYSGDPAGAAPDNRPVRPTEPLPDSSATRVTHREYRERPAPPQL
jgi:hypothetical protein